MNNNVIPNLLDVSLCLVSLFISVRSFDIYARFRQYRLFILGLSMLLVCISAAADYTANYITVVHLQTDWFLYIGQTIGFLFILLSLAQSSDSYLRSLMNLNIVSFALLLILLLLSPTLPPIVITARALLGFARVSVCLLILCGYFWAYTSQPTRFSLLMSGAFFLFTTDYLMFMLQDYVSAANQLLFRDTADIAGVLALIVLVASVSWDESKGLA
ncbi:MAG TPA: hypothetical protein VKV20_20235 [Ktedonobacteraceae bacterium]|jgi:hypothetical protein|nr:hypothetical protein [Ktedonobacteraceae bacterium]